MANAIIPGIGVHHIALTSADIDRSLKFYTEGLGFKVTATWGEGTGRAALLDIGNGIHFEIFNNGTADSEQNSRFAHVALATTDPDSVYKAAIAAGATSHIEPKDVEIPASPVISVRLAFVKGPDGEVLEFFHVK
ncbi:hypothetical protein FACS1894219_05940 [Clostridia bacterium]|nr:hypothetical protein FACS1894219_05940 [Clostridia bacterium]